MSAPLADPPPDPAEDFFSSLSDEEKREIHELAIRHGTEPADDNHPSIVELRKEAGRFTSKAEFLEYVGEIVGPDADTMWNNSLFAQTYTRAAANMRARQLVDAIGARQSKTLGRLRGAGDAVLDLPELPPAIWSKGNVIAWPSHQATMIAAQQGVGKSTIAQQLCLHRIGVRTGGLLGMNVAPLPDERTILYLAMDRPMQILQSVRRMVSESDRQVLNKRLMIWEGPLPFDLASNPRQFADWVFDVCPDVSDVVVDSVKDIMPGVAKDEVGATLNISWQEIIARGVELLLLHHQRKAQQGATRMNALDDVYGSTWLTSGLGSVFAIEGDPGARVVKLKHLKSAVMQMDDTEIRHDHATGTTVLHYHSETDLADVVRQGGEVGVTAQEAAMAVIGAAGTNELKKIRREFTELVKDGTFEKIPGARTSKGATPDRWRLKGETRWAENL